MAQDNTVAVDNSLTQAEKDKIFEEEIVPRMLPDKNLQLGLAPNEKPRVIFLAGQPGAGKTGLREMTEKEFEDKGDAVVIDVDAMRDFHPRYKEFQLENNGRGDRTAAARVQNVASEWADKLRDRAMEEKYNTIIIDATLKSRHKVEGLINHVKDHEYDPSVRGILTPKELSEQSTNLRYEGKKARGLPGRSVPPDVQADAFNGFPESIDEIEQNRKEWGKGVRITLYRRGDKKPVYDSDIHFEQDLTARNVITEERAALTPEQQKIYHENNETLSELVEAREAREGSKDEYYEPSMREKWNRSKEFLALSASPQYEPAHTITRT